MSIVRARYLCLAVCALLLAGCVGVPEVSFPPSSAPRSVAATLIAAPGDCHGSYRSYTVGGQRYWVRSVPPGYSETGLASWYGKRFHGRKTASGETFDMYQVSAAHKTLPLSSVVRVTNLHNGRQVTVRINDRGPFVAERVIDLSYAAARRLGMINKGVVPVEVIVAKIPSGGGGYAAVPDLIKVH